MRKVTQEELVEIVRKHNLWLRGESGGERADLSGCDMSYADMRGADMSYADMSNAVMSYAVMRGADMSNAVMSNAAMRGADMSYAVMSNADMSYADMSYADMRGADMSYAVMSNAVMSNAVMSYAVMRGADMSYAVMSNADMSYAVMSNAVMSYAAMRGADMSYAVMRGAKNLPYIPMTCPDFGSFIGWKKVKGKIIKLEIPSEAKRSSATGRKCRCEFAKVIAIEKPDGTPTTTVSITNHNYNQDTVYRIGEIVKPDSFDENRFNECSNGIHFFINRQEAVDY